MTDKAFEEWCGTPGLYELEEDGYALARAAWDHQQKEIDALVYDVKRCIEISSELAIELQRIQQAVDEQAEDEGLWCEARAAPEAYLQQALRRLHEAIEGVSGDEIALALTTNDS